MLFKALLTIGSGRRKTQTNYTAARKPALTLQGHMCPEQLGESVQLYVSLDFVLVRG